jgi:hypothetical protein
MMFSVERIQSYPNLEPASTDEQHSSLLHVRFLKQNVLITLSCIATEIPSRKWVCLDSFLGGGKNGEEGKKNGSN